MRTAAPLPAALVKLINDQGGAVSTAQLVALGLSEAVIRRLTRRWTTPARGVHIVGEPSWQGAVWAGLLRGGTGAVVGAEAACFLHKALRDEPRRILIWSGGGAKSGFTVGKWRVAYRRGTRRERGTPPRASLEDSLLDFARTAGELEIVSAISQAFAKRRTMPKKLRKSLAKRGRLRHRELIQALCATGWRACWSGSSSATCCSGTNFRSRTARHRPRSAGWTASTSSTASLWNSTECATTATGPRTWTGTTSTC